MTFLSDLQELAGEIVIGFFQMLWQVWRVLRVVGIVVFFGELLWIIGKGMFDVIVVISHKPWA